jgi:putative transposase
MISAQGALPSIQQAPHFRMRGLFIIHPSRKQLHSHGVRLSSCQVCQDRKDKAMARKARIHIPGGVYHVMLRGNGSQNIFFSGEDYSRLFLLLQEGAERFRYRVHAFCCMPNHLHLVLQVSDIPLSQSMQNLSFRYTQWINRRHDRRGHLFQGRYKALLVDGDTYLLELVRYVHLNPVRCGMVTDPADYSWSSHQAYLGQENLPWLTTDWVLGQFSKDRPGAQRLYSSFVFDGLAEGHRRDFHKGVGDRRVLGDDLFLEQIAENAGDLPKSKPTLDEIIILVCQNYGVEKADLVNPSQRRHLAEARAMVAWLAKSFESATLTEVGRCLNRDVGTMSSALRRLVQRAEEVSELKEEMEKFQGKMRIKLENLEA